MVPIIFANGASDQITYDLSWLSDTNSNLVTSSPFPFGIHPITGVITVTSSLDRELVDSYQLLVSVSSPLLFSPLLSSTLI